MPVLNNFFFNGTDCEDMTGYQPGGFHPVHLGDTFSKLPQSNNPRYRVLHKLGSGGFSTVWLARDLLAGSRFVALKVVVARLSDTNNESKVLKWLRTCPKDHPGHHHILELLDVFHVEGPNGTHEVLVTDVVCSIRALQERRLLSPLSRTICYQVMVGLAYLQENGVTHGDLHFDNMAIAIPGINNQSEDRIIDFFSNPECIPVVPRDISAATGSLPKYLVTPACMMDYIEDLQITPNSSSICVKIMDFGNAFRSSDVRPPPITPIFIRAPEIFFNRKSSSVLDNDWGLKSDIWSLACTLYEIVYGSVMFYGIGKEDSLIREMIKLAGPLPNRWEPYWDPKRSQRPDGGHTPSVRRNANSDALALGMLETDPQASWNKWRRKFLKGPTDDATIKSVNEFSNLLRRMLVLDPKDRPLATKLLLHPWFEARKN